MNYSLFPRFLLSKLADEKMLFVLLKITVILDNCGNQNQSDVKPKIAVHKFFSFWGLITQ
jgi:hypothetical protein